MIRVNHLRITLRNYRGSPRAAEAVARLAMERLMETSAGDGAGRLQPGTIDQAVAEPLRISPGGLGEEALAGRMAEHAWRSIRQKAR